jgi:SAM-dependent methyltransferase
VTGLDVLHLQCHIGTETLSLARRGARVVGVDFSTEAIAQARALADDLQIDAEFLEADVLRLEDSLSRRFDLVYASYGVLCWIGSLPAWAKVAAAFLVPGGRLVLIDGHPIAAAIAKDGLCGDRIKLDWPCLPGEGPIRIDTPGSYAAPDAETQKHERYQWPHGIGEILQAVIDAGLRVERFEEHTEASYGSHPGMIRTTDDRWRLPDPLHGRYPLLFTLVARKDDLGAQR